METARHLPPLRLAVGTLLVPWCQNVLTNTNTQAFMYINCYSIHLVTRKKCYKLSIVLLNNSHGWQWSETKYLAKPVVFVCLFLIMNLLDNLMGFMVFFHRKCTKNTCTQNLFVPDTMDSQRHSYGPQIKKTPELDKDDATSTNNSTK